MIRVILNSLYFWVPLFVANLVFWVDAIEKNRIDALFQIVGLAACIYSIANILDARRKK